MKFSKEKFLKNAEREVKKRVSKHLDIIDGMEVKFDGENGEIEYKVENEVENCTYVIYPVYKNWCEE